MISLSTQDADFVAKLAREQVEALESIHTENQKKMTKIVNDAKKLTAECPSEENLKGFSDVLDVYYQSKKEMDDMYGQITSKWQRVIELMLGGSDEER